MWFCKLANSPQIVGPLSDNQLRALVRQGRLQPTDAIAQDQNGPWYPASQVRGLFAQSGETLSPGQPPQQIPTPPSAQFPKEIPPSRHSQTSTPLPTPEYLARQRAYRRKQARRLTLSLVWSGLALGLVFLVVLMRPVVSSIFQTNREKRPETGQSSAIARSSEAALPEQVASIPGLDEILGHAATEPKASSQPKSESSQESRIARLTRLIAASRAFGDTAQKMRDSHGNIEMVIEDCRIAPASLRQGGLGFQTPKPYFLFKVRIRNTSPTESSHYRSPREGKETAEIWWDNASQPLSPWQRAGFALEGQVDDSSLGPGEDLVDVFAFQTPPDDAPLIYVRIPGSSVNLNADDFLFVIAKDSIQRSDKSAKSSAVMDDAEEASIGPMTTMRRNQAAAQSDSPRTGEEQPNMDEEAVPIPGIHDASASPAGKNNMDDQEQAKLEELRKRGEMMQDALDRQRANEKPGSRSRSQRR